jgi:voltage-gated potassium channel Kch
MPSSPSFEEKFQYWLDNQFSRGTGALILWLGVASLLLIFIAGAIVSLLKIAPEGGEPLSFIEGAWLSLMRTLDAGTMGGDTGWGFRIAMFLVTLGGVFVISTLIGVLTSAVEARLEDLRKGRSRVLESGHTVILGWNQQVFTILRELITANENQAKSCIVILGDADKVDMEDAIQQRVGDGGKTRIVCRSGSAMDVDDLDLVSLNTAKTIVALSPERDEPDIEVIKTVMAVTNHPRRQHDHKFHIVAQIYDPKNMISARVVGNGEVEWILVGDFIARVIAQTCRQSGLSVVYTELLDFGGDEIYLSPLPVELVGKTFGESLLAFEHNTVMGYVPAGGTPCLQPPVDTILQTGDQLIIISEDDDKIIYHPSSAAQLKKIATQGKSARKPERTLIMGWNRRGVRILTELDAYVAPGSVVTVAADEKAVENQMARCCRDMQNQTITFQAADITDRQTLEELQPGSYDHIILLCYSDMLTAQQADAHTLIVLLHLRDIAERESEHYSIVSEMMDIRNRNLADVTRADDFIVSDKLVSLMTAQVAENPQLNLVFADLFDPEGSEIYLNPVEWYVVTGELVTYATLVEAARQRGEVALGYRLASQAREAGSSYGVRVNPAKSTSETFVTGDKVIVLAEE